MTPVRLDLSIPSRHPDAASGTPTHDSMVHPDMEWSEWWTDYSNGHFPASRPPVKPQTLTQSTSDETVTGLPSPTDSTATTVSSSIPTPVSSDNESSLSSAPSSASSRSTGDRDRLSKSNERTKTSPRERCHGERTPDEAFDFYQKNRYLPAPKGQFEAERLRTIKRYGLDKPERKNAIDRICRIAKAHFKTNTVIITLVLEDIQVLVAETGWMPGREDPPVSAAPREVSLEPSLCCHAITRVDASEPFIVPDASLDFRFEKNPNTTGQGGTLAFYASSNIMVPTQQTSRSEPCQDGSEDCPEELPVGSLCLIDSKPKDQDEFTAEDKQLLKDLAYMVGQEFKLGFESARREIEQERSNFLGGFLDSTLVYSSSPAGNALSTTTKSNGDPLAACNLQQQHSAPSTRAIHSPSSPLHDFARAAVKLKDLTRSTGAALFDLRSFRAPLKTDIDAAGSAFSATTAAAAAAATALKPTLSDMGAGRSVVGSSRPPSPSSRRRTSNRTGKPSSVGLGKVYLLGGAGSVDWEETSMDPSFPPAIVDALERFYRTNQTAFDATTGHSALKDVLPESSTASCIVPIFDIDGSPTLVLVLVSTEAHFQFMPSDAAFVENVGAVAMSALLRQRALEADRAKLAFVSQISHELRTPLHGINSQIELIREFASPQQLLKLAPLLDVADVCLESLRSVLDDTLDFSKLSNNSPEEIEAAQRRSLARHDLESLCEDVTKAVWVRKKRVDLVSADAAVANGKPSDHPRGNVDVILEVQERDWGCWVDAGGMKRVLLNILGNALKFTTDGYVKLSVAEATSVTSPIDRVGPSQRVVELVVEDTGRGMSEEFLRDGKLFTPFVQENPFANGAGLGMSICDTIIRRMGGRLDVTSALGEGTTVRILVPLELCRLDEDDESSPLIATASPIVPLSISATEVPPPVRGGQANEASTSVRKRVISDELTSLFNPGAPLASPFEEHANFDFSRAVSAAQASISPGGGESSSSSDKIKRVPSLSLSHARSKNSPGAGTTGGARKLSFLGKTGTDEDFIDEMAKLTVGTASSPQPVAFGGPTNGDFFSLVTTPSRSGAESGSSEPHPGFIPKSPSKRFAERVRVLIADDNAIGRSILTKLFAGKGIDFAQAENGQEAVDVYVRDQGNFDLILVDVQMPILDGIEASCEIRKYEESNNLPRCRIIALTGFAEDHHLDHDDDNDDDDGPGRANRGRRSNPRDAVDSWLVKGGKSLAVILREVKRVEEELIQKELDATAANASDGTST